jgi:hypothetical protein
MRALVRAGTTSRSDGTRRSSREKRVSADLDLVARPAHVDDAFDFATIGQADEQSMRARRQVHRSDRRRSEQTIADADLGARLGFDLDGHRTTARRRRRADGGQLGARSRRRGVGRCGESRRIRIVAGGRRLIDYDNTFYLFANEATLQQFTANPERYATPVRQAMGLPARTVR